MKKSTKQAVDEFVRLVGGQSWTKTASRCTGKWAGTIDHSIVIDGKHDVFVTNGMTHFEERILEWCESILSFKARRMEYLHKIREQVDRDNRRAAVEGLFSVTVIDIGVVSPEATDGSHFFQPYVLIEINDRRYKFTETGFAHSILHNKIDKWLEKGSKPLRTAGAVQNPDFVFCGVKFNSRDEMYRIR